MIKQSDSQSKKRDIQKSNSITNKNSTDNTSAPITITNLQHDVMDTKIKWWDTIQKIEYEQREDSEQDDIEIIQEAARLLAAISKQEDFVVWRKEKENFLKSIRRGFENFYDRVEEQLDQIITQQQKERSFEHHKEVMTEIAKMGVKSSSAQFSFFSHEYGSGKLEKELQFRNESKSLNHSVLTDFYEEVEGVFTHLRQIQLVLLEKFKLSNQLYLEKQTFDSLDSPKREQSLFSLKVPKPLRIEANHIICKDQRIVQGKKIYNFEFSMEETQSVLLKSENELILIGEYLKIWDNRLRRIIYEKKIEQKHELKGKKYSIGWSQFSAYGNNHVVIGNNSTRQIFLFAINPFRLTHVLSQNERNASFESKISLDQESNVSQTHLESQTSSSVEDQQNTEIKRDTQEEDIEHNQSKEYGNFLKVSERIMACCSGRSQIEVWDLVRNKLLHTIKTDVLCSNKINRLIRIDKKTIASHSENENRLKVWNCESGRQKRQSILLSTKTAQSMWIFKRFLYVLSFKNIIYVYNMDNFKMFRFIHLPFQIVLSKQLSQNFLVGVQNKNEVFIFSLTDFSLKKVIKMESQITDIIVFNSRVFATFTICSESRKGKIEYLH